MQIKRQQIEKRIFVAEDGMEFPTAVECRRHEATQTYLKCKVDTISYMGDPKYIVKCQNENELRDVLEFFDYTYSTDGFSSNFDEESVRRLVPGYIVLEFSEDEVMEHCLIYPIDELIFEIDEKIKALSNLKTKMLERSNEVVPC